LSALVLLVYNIMVVSPVLLICHNGGHVLFIDVIGNCLHSYF